MKKDWEFLKTNNKKKDWEFLKADTESTPPRIKFMHVFGLQ